MIAKCWTRGTFRDIPALSVRGPLVITAIGFSRNGWVNGGVWHALGRKVLNEIETLVTPETLNALVPQPSDQTDSAVS